MDKLTKPRKIELAFTQARKQTGFLKMKNKLLASYKKCGSNFMPVIVHSDGRRELLPGDPLVTRKRAMFYASITIADRNQIAYRQQCRETYTARQNAGYGI